MLPRRRFFVNAYRVFLACAFPRTLNSAGNVLIQSSCPHPHAPAEKYSKSPQQNIPLPNSQAIDSRIAWVNSQYARRTISDTPFDGMVDCFGRLEVRRDDPEPINWLVNTFPKVFEGSWHGNSFIFPFLGWILNKHGDSFTSAQLQKLLPFLKKIPAYPRQDTENHMLGFLVGQYLIIQPFPGEDGWQKSGDASEAVTWAEARKQSRERLLAMLQGFYDKGNEEHNSNAYVAVSLRALFALYANANEPEMVAAAKAGIIYFMVNLAISNVDGTVVPSFSRKNIEPTNLAESGRRIYLTQSLYWFFFAELTRFAPDGDNVHGLTQITPLSCVLAAASSGWRPSGLLYEIASGSNTTPYSLTGCRPTTDNSLASGQGPLPAEQIRYMFRHSLYAMGSSYCRYHLEWPLWHHPFHSNVGFGIVYSTTKSWNTIEAGHSYWNSASNDHWQYRTFSSACKQTAQYEGTAILLINIPPIDPLLGRGRADFHPRRLREPIQQGWLRYPRLIDQQVQQDGWIFLREGSIFIAIRPLNTFTLDTNVDMGYFGRNAFNLVRVDGPRTGFLIDIATSEEIGTFDDFVVAILGRQPSVDLRNLRVIYTNVNGYTLQATWNPPDYTSNPVLSRCQFYLNGSLVAEDRDFLHGRAVVKSPVCELKDKVLSYRCGDFISGVDWSGESPKFS